MKIKIGTIELKKPFQFTQYSEHAAWTDYVQCNPQIVDLYYDGSYWVFASFNGSLAETTFPNRDNFRKIGEDWKAHLQTQAFGGIGAWLDSEFYRVRLENLEYVLSKVGNYHDGSCMYALQSLKHLANLEKVTT